MHAVRVVAVPPLVYDPAAHVLQAATTPVLYLFVLVKPHGKGLLLPSHS